MKAGHGWSGFFCAALLASGLAACEPDSTAHDDTGKTENTGGTETAAPPATTPPVTTPAAETLTAETLTAETMSPAPRSADHEPPADAADDFDYDGLPPGAGREDVFVQCSTCHSLRLVMQQRLSRERWEEILEWMVEEQGMAALSYPEQDRILDYLGTHFGLPD